MLPVETGSLPLPVLTSATVRQSVTALERGEAARDCDMEIST